MRTKHVVVSSRKSMISACPVPAPSLPGRTLNLVNSKYVNLFLVFLDQLRPPPSPLLTSSSGPRETRLPGRPPRQAGTAAERSAGPPFPASPAAHSVPSRRHRPPGAAGLQAGSREPPLCTETQRRPSPSAPGENLWALPRLSLWGLGALGEVGRAPLRNSSASLFVSTPTFFLSSGKEGGSQNLRGGRYLGGEMARPP